MVPSTPVLLLRRALSAAGSLTSAAATDACSLLLPACRHYSKKKTKQNKGNPAAAWPKPGRLTLPDAPSSRPASRRAAAPAIGRVPPSSRAAAAAAAAHMQQQQQQQQQRQQQRQQQHAPVAPWHVVAALPASSPYSLERMAAADNVSTYLKYMRDARHGMPSVFELGVVRQQGRQGRAELLRREVLLQHLVDQVRLAGAGQQQHKEGSGASSEVTDEQLQQVTEDQLEAAASSAAAARLVACGATAADVADSVMDYFVAQRCMQLMLMQRQHRQLMQLRHAAAEPATAQQQQADQHQQGCQIWDAFFDADLSDFQEYLGAGSAGVPTVFTTINPEAEQQRQQDGQPPSLQQQQEQAAKARQQLLQASRLLALMPEGMKDRPGLLIGRDELLQLAAMAGADVEDVVMLLDDFYKLRRLGFRAALQELTGSAAGAGGSLEAARF